MNRSLNDLPLEVESRFFALKLGVEVRRSMVVEEHANDDPEEGRDDRHGLILPEAAATFGGITVLPLSRGNRTRKSSTYNESAAVAVGCSGVLGGAVFFPRSRSREKCAWTRR